MESGVEELAKAWGRFMAEVEFPQDFDDTATPEAHHVNEIVQARIRGHIVATNDIRLFSLLHLLGHASLRMEQVLWPEEYERILRDVEEAVKDVDSTDADWISHEEAIQTIRQKINMARDKPC